MKRTIKLLVPLVVLALAMIVVGGCSKSGNTGGSTGGNTGGASSTPGQVVMENFAFSPASIQINKGESVTWVNKDSATHDVQGDGGINSGNMSKGSSYTKTFDTAGTYQYKCSIHPSMTGTVIVK